MLNLSGKFLTLEGVEGAGKSTALEFISAFLTENGIEFIKTREPGGTNLGEKVRDILLDKTNTEIHSDTELLLMFAARSQHWHELILPTLKAGKWVISDRFTDSSFAYQGGGRGLDLARIRALANWTLDKIQPDLTLLFDLDPALGLQRVNRRGDSDRFETEKIDFFTKVREVFLELAQKEPARFKVIDSAADIKHTQEQIARILRKLI